MTTTGLPLLSHGSIAVTMHDIATFSLLSDSDLTVADADEDIRGRTVKIEVETPSPTKTRR